MKAKQSIPLLSMVPAQKAAPVKALLSKEEKQFLDLLAQIAVKNILKESLETPVKNLPAP